MFMKCFRAYLTIGRVDNLGEKSSEMCHISVVWGELIDVKTLGMKRDLSWTIVLQPVTVENVTIANLKAIQDMAGLDGRGFTNVLDEAITLGSAWKNTPLSYTQSNSKHKRKQKQKDPSDACDAPTTLMINEKMFSKHTEPKIPREKTQHLAIFHDFGPRCYIDFLWKDGSCTRSWCINMISCYGNPRIFRAWVNTIFA